MNELTEGPPRYYRPVCIKWPAGFIGGPSAYEETEDKDCGPKIVDSRDVRREA